MPAFILYHYFIKTDKMNFTSKIILLLSLVTFIQIVGGIPSCPTFVGFKALVGGSQKAVLLMSNEPCPLCSAAKDVIQKHCSADTSIIACYTENIEAQELSAFVDGLKINHDVKPPYVAYFKNGMNKVGEADISTDDGKGSSIEAGFNTYLN